MSGSVVPIALDHSISIMFRGRIQQ